jgi:D-serine deaminase-like pyridoxal phosphate-dependent protein
MKKWDLDTPCVCIDLDIMERNLKAMADFASSHSLALRPHVKTHKIPELARLQVEHGACGVTVAKVGEAEIFVEAGLDNIFIANQVMGAGKLERLTELARRARVMAAVDSVQNAAPLDEAASGKDLTLEVYIEVDAGLGRCGVHSPQQAVALAQEISRMSGLRLVGVFTHEGQVSRARTREELEQKATSAADFTVRVASALRDAGFAVEVISVGSTPAARVAPLVKGITEMRPGTYIFNDRNMLALDAASPSDCALAIQATVISRPADDRAIIDAGSKILGSDPCVRGAGFGLVIGHEGIRVERLWEEHGLLSLPPACESPGVGDRIEVIPNHCCHVMNLVDFAYGVRGENVEAQWKVAARGKVS